MNVIQKPAKLANQDFPQTLAELPFAGHMTIWGFRLLAAGWRLDINVSCRLMEGYSKCHAERAGAALILLADSFFDHLARDIYINCPCNPDLSQDERLLLELCSTCQTDAGTELLYQLTRTVDPDQCSIVVSMFREFAEALSDAGLLLRLPSSIVERRRPEPRSRFIPASSTRH